MPVYTAREIYRFMRMAGFTPDEAVTMTAITLAESGGDSLAHNTNNEDSRGLLQINFAAHPEFAGRNLYDPLENAKAAYEVSDGGTDVSPWTTTHGLDGEAPYVAFQAEAQAAARASGDPGGGVWTGTEGYGHPLAAGSDVDGGSGTLQTFLDSALAQEGDSYVFGAEAGLGDADPDTFDCSELVQWAAGRAGVELPDGSWMQYLELQEQGATISVEQALKTPGALLFSFSSRPTAGGGRPEQAHVAISLGDGRTIEAQSPEAGVDTFDAGDRFQYAAVIPGISDGAGGASTAFSVAAGGSAVDTDRDGLTDDLEARLGLSKTLVDSDRDNVSDGYELLTMKTDPTSADSDHDRLLDSLEMAIGMNPLDPDSDQDGQVDGAKSRPGGTADRDHDGVSDLLEQILGSDPTSADSDRDGFVDGAEYRSPFDLTDAGSNPLARPGPGGGGRAGGSPGGGTDPAGGDPLSSDPTGDDPVTGTPRPAIGGRSVPAPPDPAWGLDDLDITS